MIYGYIRVSTDKQTVENQRFEINRFCVNQSITIGQWIEETVSTRKELKDRKFGKFLKKMKKGDVLLCSELSRLGRNMYEIMSILYECMTNGIQVWTTKNNFKLGTDVHSKVMAFAFGIAAELERDLIAQRTREALARLKAAGVKLGNHYKLEGRDAEVQKLLNEKITKKAIAAKLGVSPQAVYNYIRHKI
jgi:DNA invertase Pin-like site-specific DNA recombinase